MTTRTRARKLRGFKGVSNGKTRRPPTSIERVFGDTEGLEHEYGTFGHPVLLYKKNGEYYHNVKRG